MDDFHLILDIVGNFGEVANVFLGNQHALQAALGIGTQRAEKIKGTVFLSFSAISASAFPAINYG
jgi:hypothetical protein